MVNTTADPAFKVIPRNATSFFIWRIEHMQVVPVPRDQYGKFYKADSYVIYSASEVGKPGGVALKKRDMKPGEVLEQNIHFWLGSETQADEAGTAAFKTVELDDYLGGTPVQHREVEGKESGRFISYFPDGIRYLQGGIGTGFRHVDTVKEPRLYQVKGRRRPAVHQLPGVSWEYMNDGDSFLLHVPEAVFLWTGKTSNKAERLQAARVADKLRSEGGVVPVIFVEDGEETKLPDGERKLFNKYLEIRSKNVVPAAEAPVDEEEEDHIFHDLRLYQCSDEEGTLRVAEVKSAPLLQSDLVSEHSYIIDNGSNGIWVWIGKRASEKERIEAMRNAQGFIKKKGYPDATHVSRVIEEGEPIEFKTLFQSWRDKNDTVGLGKTTSGNRGVAHTVQTKFDASTLHEQPRLAAQTQLVDNGSGQKEIWRVHNFDIVPVPSQRHGVFYDRNAYIMKYTYYASGQDHVILYFWLGSKSNQDDQGTAAFKTVEMDHKLDNSAVQVRVVQGKENPHFMAVFQGKMVVFQGEDPADEGGRGWPKFPFLMQVHGRSEHDTLAEQVPLTAVSLNSGDVFILFANNTTYVWCGQGSTGDEREMAKKGAERGHAKAEIVTVWEGQEKDDFWEAIGGRKPYSNSKRLADGGTVHPARLFQCSQATGNFKAEEIVHFVQNDMEPTDVMILDAWDTIFIWIGEQSRPEEKKMAQNLAREYLRTDPSGRELDTPIYVIKQGFEPPNFVGFFGLWDRTLWGKKKTFEDIKREIVSGNAILKLPQEQESVHGDAFEEQPKYPLEILQEREAENLPKDVDATQKELHLSSEDFQRHFHMTYKEYKALPAWKQQNLKKPLGLF